jgi:dTDP-glucose 4,6-dehydratase
MEKAKFVVIGSNSFSGAHFIDHLLDQGHSVIGISRSAEIEPCFLPYLKNENKASFRFMQLDLNKDLERINTSLDDFQPGYVVNFASQSMVAESWQNPDHWFMTNTVSTIRLHEKLRTKNYLQKYVHISTPEVYGSCSGVVKENTNYQPSTPYATSRAAADMSLVNFVKNYNFPVVFTRAANVFGPGQQLYRIVPRAVLSALTGKKFPLHGGGSSVRSFIHIKDVAEGTLLAALHGKPGDIFHFSTAEFQSIREVVEKVAGAVGVPLGEIIDNAHERAGKDAAYLLDSTKAGKELGWKAKHNFNDGMNDTITWAKENLEVLKKLPVGYVHKA